MHVFRIHIRPGGLENSEISFNYCLNNNLLGVGWRVPKEPNELINWDTYEQRSRGKISIVRYINKWVSKDDLVWTRDTKGQYYLGKVLSPWEYFDNPEARVADIVNIFRVQLKKVGSIDKIPGKIIACFRARRTIQEIADEPAIIYTKMLWNHLSGDNVYKIEKTIDSVWSLLSDEQVEDLIFLYLQANNWYVVPNSRKKDTMSYEFYVINKTNFERAWVQAKTGESPINLDNYQANNETVFLFQPNDCFSGGMKEHFHIIKKEEIESFIKNNQKIIPANILSWYLWRADSISFS